MNKICECVFCLMKKSPLKSRGPPKFLRKLFYNKHCQLELKGTKRVQNEGRPLNAQNYTDRKQADKTNQLQTHATFQENGRMIITEPKVQRVELRAMKNDSQTLKSNQVTLIICLARFQNCCGSLTPFYFPFPPCLIGNVYSCNAVLISLYVGCVGST